MLGKNRIKQINALQIKKFRNETGLFVAEGSKVIYELLKSKIKIIELFAVPEWIESHANILTGDFTITPVNAEEIRKISAMSTACSVVALATIPQQQNNFVPRKDELFIALDAVRDPGNFGTILRTANWYGIKTLICSKDTVDLFNPKTVQASMGSAFRINVIYTDLQPMLKSAAASGIEVFGTFLNGENIYKADLPSSGIIVMGNEGHGIIPEIEVCITRRLSIPCFEQPKSAPESLNVSSAASVILSEFLRRKC